jgi:hypothetical protein
MATTKDKSMYSKERKEIFDYVIHRVTNNTYCFFTTSYNKNEDLHKDIINLSDDIIKYFAYDKERNERKKKIPSRYATYLINKVVKESGYKFIGLTKYSKEKGERDRLKVIVLQEKENGEN